MDLTQFDRLTQGLVVALSRRRALRTGLGAGALGLLSVAMRGDAAVAFKTLAGCKKHCRRHEGSCRNGCNQCCKKVVTGKKNQCDFGCGVIKRK
jgi:hypothetical protein